MLSVLVGIPGRQDVERDGKVQARYGLLLESTSKTAGDFAATQDSFANSTKTSNALLEDAQAKVGAALLPAFEKFTAFMLTDGVPLIEKLVDVFVEAAPAISATADAGISLLDFFLSNVSLVIEFFDAMEDGKLTAQEAAAAIALLPQPIRDLLGGVRDFITGATVGIANFLARGFNGFVGILNGFIGLLRPVVDTFNALFGTNLSLPRINGMGTISSIGSPAYGNSRPRNAGGGRRAMADGGIVTARPGGIPATIGEGRYDEAVIPLSPSALAQLGEAMGEGSRFPDQLTLMVDGRPMRAYIQEGITTADFSGRMTVENGKKRFA